jgi:hypothetical protein
MINTYSQAGQDLFALDENKNLSNLFFIDIGCHDPIIINNSYLLELNGWKGLSFDIDDYSNDYTTKRKNKFIRCDAANYDFKKCFK